MLGLALILLALLIGASAHSAGANPACTGPFAEDAEGDELGPAGGADNLDVVSASLSTLKGSDDAPRPTVHIQVRNLHPDLPAGGDEIFWMVTWPNRDGLENAVWAAAVGEGPGEDFVFQAGTREPKTGQILTVVPARGSVVLGQNGTLSIQLPPNMLESAALEPTALTMFDAGGSHALVTADRAPDGGRGPRQLLEPCPQVAANALTPEGYPALLAGPSLQGLSSRVIVEWTVRVGEASRPGRLTPMMLRDRAAGTAALADAGETVQLPTSPGTHRFPARLPIVPKGRLGLFQATGGHALLHYDAAVGGAVDVWRTLPTDRQRPPEETLAHRKLLVSVETEVDRDRDGFGDRSQDVNALRLSVRRLHGEIIRAVVTNEGKRTVHQPRLEIHGGRVNVLRRPRCRSRGGCQWERPSGQGAFRVDLAPLAPRARHLVILRAAGRRALEVSATAEGPHETPGGATIRLRPR